MGTRLPVGVNAEPSTGLVRLTVSPPPLEGMRSEEGSQGRVRDGLALICAQVYADILRHTVTIEQ